MARYESAEVDLDTIRRSDLIDTGGHVIAVMMARRLMSERGCYVYDPDRQVAHWKPEEPNDAPSQAVDPEEPS